MPADCYEILESPVRADESEHTSSLKSKSPKEWLNLILCTRELTPDLKKRIDAGKIFACELHFKPECILASMYI